MNQGIAPSTKKVYNTAQTLFLKFCSRLNLTAMPASESTLILFVTELAQTRAHATLKSYLSGVRFLHITHGFPNPLANLLRLDLVLKGIKRIKPRPPSQIRLPITPAILRRIRAGLTQIQLSDTEEKMMWAACTLAFFAFLRCGEFTQASLTSYDSSKHLSQGDIAVNSHDNPTVMSVRIKSSKTDQFGEGVTLYLGKGCAPLCPISSMMQYLAIRSPAPGPLFVDDSNKPLTKQAFISKVHSALSATGMSTEGYKGHSFRIGAATTAAACGVSEHLIKTMGRWSSEAYHVYIRTPPNELTKVSLLLANSHLD